nr:glycosyltransferase family 2 protein [Chthoniobacterales bacterium]
RELQRTLARHTRHLLAGALKQDVANWFRRTEVSSGKPTEPLPVNFAHRAAVINKREAYKVRLDQQEAAHARGEPVAELHDNDPYGRCAAPKLSVLITLYNYAQHIEECVASVARGAEELDAALEVVIVNDGSTDSSLPRALDCLRRSQLPIRLVDKRFNTGLADARNMALRIARAPYVFMLDADNLIYRQALRQLLDVITEGDCAAAYSMLCRFRGNISNRVGLLSYFDFDPQILVQYPYIDAMAMFSRDALLELGGYDNQLSQIGWFGWEDYDMWLKYARCGLPVCFVPNILCLYRHHETSMINTTNLFESDLVHHFMIRHGDLLNQFEPRTTVFGVDRQKIATFRNANDLPIDDGIPRREKASSMPGR